MRNFQEFIDKKIAVVFDSEKEIDKFYELCVKNNKINETVITKKDDVLKSYVYFSKEYQVPLVSYGGAYDYLRVKASEFLASAPTIEIFQSKQTVVCLKKQDGKVVAVGKAKCNPEDAFDFKTGSDLAYSRMNSDEWKRNNPESYKAVEIGMLALDGFIEGMQLLTRKERKKAHDEESKIKTLKNGMKIIKQDRYEVGDKVKFFKKIDGRKQLHSGEVGEVIETRGGHCKLKFNGGVDRYFYGSFRIKGKVIE